VALASDDLLPGVITANIDTERFDALAVDDVGRQAQLASNLLDRSSSPCIGSSRSGNRRTRRRNHQYRPPRVENRLPMRATRRRTANGRWRPAAVVAGMYAPAILEPSEHVFDLAAVLIVGGVIGDGGSPCTDVIPE
jgi:hypothetical protein